MRSSEKLLGIALGGVMALASTQGVAAAQPNTRVLYAHRSWEVRGVVFDTGAPVCVALVRLDGAAFSIWADGANPIRLQFYSPGWAFGDTVSDMEVQVDARDEWTLGDADLFQNAVFFDLPTDDVSIQFLTQVAQGGQLHLRDGQGGDMQSYTLAGSDASIRALGRCVDALRARPGDPDPFD